uniref:ABC transporter ATP-binding protein n=1 Tax=Halalkalibacter okhensis TaxID=333138 RepID=UPI00068F709F
MVSTDKRNNSISIIEVKRLNKIYKNNKGKETHALSNINISIKPSEFISIIGPSGCGKSTLLQIVAGLEEKTSGELNWNSEEGEIGYVFQDATLLPWKNVWDNAKFPLEMRKKDTIENLEKLERLLDFSGLADFKHAFPKELSGGMKQRVSIVRALSYDPDILLMDEPFGALDAMTRDKMNLELLRVWQETNKTVLFITHSISEAVFLSDRVIIMSPRPGRIQKVLDINLPRPRHIELKDTSLFIEYVKELRGLLQYE